MDLVFFLASMPEVYYVKLNLKYFHLQLFVKIIRFFFYLKFLLVYALSCIPSSTSVLGFIKSALPFFRGRKACSSLKSIVSDVLKLIPKHD